MKLNRFKIDGLLLFYILSLGLLGLSWRFDLIELEEKSELDGKETLVLAYSHQVHTTVGSQNTVHSVITTNPSHDLHYSTDGGKTFINAGDSLVIDNAEIKDISNISTSYRWRQPFDSGPHIISLKFLVKDRNSGEISNSDIITNVNNVHTRLPIVHLSINENELFNDFGGLMVLGSESWHNDDFQEAWWLRDANFTQRGTEWEKEVYFQYFENGKQIHMSRCGLRISGNATRGFPQKSLRINARKRYGEDKFDHAFFGSTGIKKYESLVIRMSGNDNTKTMFADLLMQRLAQNAELLTQKGKPVLMFINGNYWGIYNLRERIDDYFIAKHSNSKKKNVTILEDGGAELKAGSEKKQAKFLKLIEDLKKLDQVSKKDLEKIDEKIDLDSYMDYIFFETYYANNDWPDNNAMCYKIKGDKWKWLLNDLDYSLAYPGQENVQLNMFEKIKGSSSVHAVIFNKLITNQDFKKDFLNRCKKNMDMHLSENRITDTYLKLKEEYEAEILQQIERWRNIDSYKEWEKNCENNLSFLLARREIYLNHLDAL